jgi:hypothetical protein
VPGGAAPLGFALKHVAEILTNPFYIGNFDSLRTSDPLVYQQMSTLTQFTSTTIQKNRLLRPFPHMNGLSDSSNANGKARTHALEVNFQRRLSKGFNLSANTPDDL